MFEPAFVLSVEVANLDASINISSSTVIGDNVFIFDVDLVNGADSWSGSSIHMTSTSDYFETKYIGWDIWSWVGKLCFISVIHTINRVKWESRTCVNRVA